MIIAKVINNNVVSSHDDKGIEVIVMGKGIVFENALLWEIKRYYKDEFNAGLKAIEVVRKRTGIVLPEDEAASVAMLTHLKFFVQRAISRKYYETDDQVELLNEIKKTCNEEYQCALKIKHFMEKKTNYIVSDEEILYLTMHINRIKLRSNNI
ncbi:PRD domain-containing protein [Lachnobacterium bovis]|uniref:PRD domain-containing protein n=1 Tax=Lachnobacterium bovis TaxID=140626 RepID=UPI0003B7A38E|nr:PRD domain-containing protein [Lachnobacterium bovis]